MDSLILASSCIEVIVSRRSTEFTCVCLAQMNPTGSDFWKQINSDNGQRDFVCMCHTTVVLYVWRMSRHPHCIPVNRDMGRSIQTVGALLQNVLFTRDELLILECRKPVERQSWLEIRRFQSSQEISCSGSYSAVYLNYSQSWTLPRVEIFFFFWPRIKEFSQCNVRFAMTSKRWKKRSY